MNDVKALLYRSSLDLRSGAGQLLYAQLLGLERARVRSVIACEHGALKFWLRTRRWPRRGTRRNLAAWQREGWLLVDHGASVPTAEIVFVHNLATEANSFTPGARPSSAAEREYEFFRRLRPSTLVVANSELVRAALARRFALHEDRLRVLFPGYDEQRFNLDVARRLRPAARRVLGVRDDQPLVGFVTSGDFAKRGLDLFLEAAARIAAARPDVRFLVVGSKRLPPAAAEHPLARRGVLHYRPKSGRPESWFAALDVFLYPAHFEEFGMVVSEAQAMGVPVLTSRRVGASECLPPTYARWLLEQPDAECFARHALSLLDDERLRAELAATAAVTVARHDRRAYVDGTLATLQAVQKRRNR